MLASSEGILIAKVRKSAQDGYGHDRIFTEQYVNYLHNLVFAFVFTLKHLGNAYIMEFPWCILY